MMEIERVFAAYFSPTGTTRTVVTRLAASVAEDTGGALCEWDFTRPEGRKRLPGLGASDVFIIGLPVYAGRLPNLLLDFLSSLPGKNALAVAVVLYGNRSYGNALIELRDLLGEDGFHVFAAAAFVGQHSFSTQLAAGRPDVADLALARHFAVDLGHRIKALPGVNSVVPVTVPGAGAPGYGGYYRPLGISGETVNLLKVKPATTAACIGCKRCAFVCPLGSIDTRDPHRVSGICIKCNACIKICPTQAKQFTDPAYLSHLQYLESTFTSRAAVELF